MTIRALPDRDILHQLMEYDPSTGNLTWKTRSPEFFLGHETRTAEELAKSWNSRCAGKPALASINRCGYRTGFLLGLSTKAHRVIFKMMTGLEPPEVDHINRDRSDNRWVNLRGVDRSGNQRNASRRRDNRSGVTGVCWSEKHNRWHAEIGGKKNRTNLGYFKTKREAVAARRAEAERQGYHPNHGRIEVAV